MPDALAIFMIKIALVAGRFLQTKLADQESSDRVRHFKISAREDAEKPCRAQHERKAEAVVVTTQPIDDLSIASIQMEIPRQLFRGRSGGKTGITLPLLIGQVASGQYRAA
jgi:hypothetical protein